MNPTLYRALGLPLATLSALISCTNAPAHDATHNAAVPQPHDHGHHHDHGEDAIGITLWTKNLELYAEHAPAIAGQKLTFLAHLTALKDFSALANAAGSLELQGPEYAQARVAKPLRPGIFQLSLTAPAAGTYSGRLVVEGPTLQDTINGFEIVVYPNSDAAKKAIATSHDEHKETIAFLKEQQWQVPFATAFAIRGTLIPTTEVTGEVTTPPSGQADVGAAITGRVVAPAAGLPRPGQAVHRGQLLATIAPAPTSPEAGARADLAVFEAEARVEAAQAAVARAERLIANRAIAQREVDEAHRELKVAQESVQAARRARDLFLGAARGKGSGIYRVSAPIEGVVAEVKATAGKSVQSGELLFRLVNLDELWIVAHIPEQEAARIVADQDAAYMLQGLETWVPLQVTGDDPQASIVNIGRVVDHRSRTVDIIYALATPDERLRVGAMVRVAVPIGEPWQGIVVPRSAVLDDEGRSIIYVQREGEAFEERTVRIGCRSGAYVGIESGVRDQERIVTRGANIIRLSANASTAPAHGHVH